MLRSHLSVSTAKALCHSVSPSFPLSDSFSLWVWHVCLASGGSDLALLRMMILPEGLAGHCLTVICLLQPCGEGWLGVAWRWWWGWSKEEKKGKKEKSSVREREREKEELEGRRNHRLLWTPSLTRPNLQDILDSSTLPLQLCSFLSSFSGSLNSKRKKGVKSIATVSINCREFEGKKLLKNSWEKKVFF